MRWHGPRRGGAARKKAGRGNMDKDTGLIAHLLRRAGFGATPDELDSYAAKGYEATVEELLDPGIPHAMPDDLIRRYHFDQSGMMSNYGPFAHWLYRMITTAGPLQEKVSLFWHGIFATSYNKIAQGKNLADQVRMFRRHGMGSFRTLLAQVSKDPAMIVWLDNHDNHKDAVNENYAREILELFSMGVGNYTEQDIKEAARAFTGWTIRNPEYMELRALNNALWPYNYIAWSFEYRPEDHDDGVKEFLGERGRFNGEDIVDIICRQPATARFISRHMYSFFVADEPPVPRWHDIPPSDPEAIELLSQTYFGTNYDIRSMLRVLFNSDFFRSESTWRAKVKSPAELVVGLLRLTGDYGDRPRRQFLDRAIEMGLMGQELLTPLTVEGWHQGTEWIDSGTLVERINFVAQELADPDRPGIKTIIDRVVADGGGDYSPERLVETCLAYMDTGPVARDVRSALVEFASERSGPPPTAAGTDEQIRGRVGEILQMAAATSNFQLA